MEKSKNLKISKKPKVLKIRIKNKFMHEILRIKILIFILLKSNKFLNVKKKKTKNYILTIINFNNKKSMNQNQFSFKNLLDISSISHNNQASSKNQSLNKSQSES